MLSFRSRKSLSQNFLVDESIAGFISGCIELSNETVVEIGAGTGVLTRALAAKARKVVALELDKQLIPVLEENLRSAINVQIINCDALGFDFKGFKIVFGNIPYKISSPLLFKLLETSFEKAILCLQKEFALRLIAQPCSSDYSRLSVMVQCSADAKIIRLVSRKCFTPQPRVDSAIVLLEKKRKKYSVNPLLVNALFQHKNKLVKNALVESSSFLKKSGEELKEFAESLEYNAKRVRELSLKEIAEISLAYNKFFP